MANPLDTRATEAPGRRGSGARRLALLAGASLLAMAGGPALAAPCVPSSRTIATSVAGPVETDGGVLTIASTGAVTNTAGTAIQASCPAIRVDNAGTVLGFTGVEVPDAMAVDVLANTGGITGGGGLLARGIAINNAGTIGTLINDGAIRGGGSIGIYNGGSIGALSNNGLVNAVGGTGIENVGTIGQLTNSGTVAGVSGIGGGIHNLGAIGQLTNGGTITGSGSFVSGFGINNVRTIGQLINHGTISGFGGFLGTGYGIFNPGTIGEVINSGSISGGGGKFGFGYGIHNSGTMGAVTNSGTLGGNNGVAIFSSGTIGPLTNSGVVRLGITVENQNFTIFGGTGSNFGTLTGGTLTVANGNLLFGGGNQLLAQTISVNGGRGSVTNAGNLLLTAPQTVNGHYVQGQAGSLIINLGTATAGRLDVTRTVTLTNATLAVRTAASDDGSPGSFTPEIGQQFTIVTAEGGIQGGFAAIMPPDGSATRFATSSDGSVITLQVLPASYLVGGLPGQPALTLTSNQAAVAGALDMVRVSGAAPSIFAVLDAMPASALPAVFTQMAPTVFADGLTAGRDAWFLMTQAIAAEQAARRGTAGEAQGGGQGGGDSTDRGGTIVWMAGLGQINRLNSGDAPGFSGTAAGLVAGVDAPLTPDMRAGAALGFTRFALDSANAARLTGQTLHLAVYGSHEIGRGFIDAQVGGLLSEGDSTRSVSGLGTQAQGQPRMQGVGGMVRGGMRMMLDGWRIEPSVGLAGMRAALNGFTETGTGAQTIGATGLSSLRTVTELRVERGLVLGGAAILVSARVGWVHELMQTRASVPASFAGVPGSYFVVTGAPQGRDAALLGLGATVDIGHGATVRLDYAGAMNSRGSAQSLSGTLRVAF